MWKRKCLSGVVGVALLALIAAALGLAAGGHATSNRPSRNIDLHWGDHLLGNAIKVSCGYSLGAQQQHPHLYCFGPSTKGGDPELLVSWTRGAVHVTRCWNDCTTKKEALLTARR